MTIDSSTFKALQDAAGAEFVTELVDTFLEEAPRMMESLEGALAARDADTFRRAAHTLKSNSYTFGAMSLGAQAKALELGGLASASNGLSGFRDEYARVAAALKQLRDA